MFPYNGWLGPGVTSVYRSVYNRKNLRVPVDLERAAQRGRLKSEANVVTSRAGPRPRSHLAGWEFDAAIAEFTARLSERPEFYRGTTASVTLADYPLAPDQLEALRAVLATAGIELGPIGEAPPVQELARRRALRPKAETDVKLSDSAKSLVADFAGARADLAQRRNAARRTVRRAERRRQSRRPASRRCRQLRPTRRPRLRSTTRHAARRASAAPRSATSS